jgi:hypothetical protein
VRKHTPIYLALSTENDQDRDITSVVSEVSRSSPALGKKDQDQDTTYVVSEASMPVPVIGENDPSGSPTREASTE